MQLATLVAGDKKPAAKVFPYPQSGKSDKCIIIKDCDVEAANPNPNFERRFFMTKGSIINYLTAPHKMSRYEVARSDATITIVICQLY